MVLKKTRQLIETIKRFDLEFVGQPNEKVDFCKKLNKDFEEWKKRTGSSDRKLFIELEKKRLRAELKRIDQIARDIDQLRTDRPGLVFDILAKNEAYVKLGEYINFLNRGGPGELTHRITEEEFKGYFYPAFYMKRKESIANQTRFQLLMEDINKHLLDANSKQIAIVAYKLYRDWILKDKVPHFNTWLGKFYDFVGRGSTDYKPSYLEGNGEYLKLFSFHSELDLPPR